MTETAEPAISVKYFKEHKCSLPEEKMSHRISCGKLRRLILNLSSVSPSDARARAMFRSYASLGAEKYRHFKFYPFTIHPFSKLRLYFETTLVLLIVFDVLLYLHANSHANKKINWDICIISSSCLDLIYSIHIILNVLTGYVEGHTQKCVVLKFKKASCRYLKTWFSVDLLSGSYGVYALTGDYFDEEGRIYIPLALSLLRLLRVPRVFCYARNIFEARNVRIKIKTGLATLFLIVVFVCHNLWVQFEVEYVRENTHRPVSPSNCSWLAFSQLWNETEIKQFAYGIEQSVLLLRRSLAWRVVTEDRCFELYVIIAWSIAQIVISKCISMYLIILIASDATNREIFIATKLVQAYMEKLKLPSEFQKRVLKFFSIKYHSHYMVESHLLKNVTGRLREDIILHTRWHLVQGVEFLRQLPRDLLIQIAFTLKVEIIAAGDIVYKVSDNADNIYFIERGTIAVYSRSGGEVRHYEDGDYFGIGSFFTASPVRQTTAVAVTTCELFRLDRKDFDNTVARYPVLYEEIKKAALERMEWIVVFEEKFRNISKAREAALLKQKSS